MTFDSQNDNHHKNSCLRSYPGESTRSHLNSEVKHLWAGLVEWWVTTFESPVLKTFFFFLFFFFFFLFFSFLFFSFLFFSFLFFSFSPLSFFPFFLHPPFSFPHSFPPPSSASRQIFVTCCFPQDNPPFIHFLLHVLSSHTLRIL